MSVGNGHSGNRDFAAGILPFAVHNGQVVFLVGKDAQDSVWSDFGGKVESVDRSELDTAIREFQEETCGAVLDGRALRVRMGHPANYRVLQSMTQSRHPYYMHVLQLPFDPGTRKAFHNVLAFLRMTRMPKRYAEKSDIQWVTWAELQKLNLRTVFHGTIVRHQRYLRDVSATGDVQGVSEVSSS